MCRFRKPLCGALNSGNMNAGWTIWATYRCPQERAYFLIGLFATEVLIASIFLIERYIQRLVAFLTYEYYGKLPGWGKAHYSDYDLSTHSRLIRLWILM